MDAKWPLPPISILIRKKKSKYKKEYVFLRQGIIFSHQ